jgi:hypothetical protein
MRAIKFRQPIFDSKGKWLRFHYWGYLKDAEDDAKPVFIGPIEGESQQFTGLLDRHRNEIYEGDIIRYNGAGDLFDPEEYTVKYKRGAFKPVDGLYNPGWPSHWQSEHSCEIVSNIYKRKKVKHDGDRYLYI